MNLKTEKSNNDGKYRNSADETHNQCGQKAFCNVLTDDCIRNSQALFFDSMIIDSQVKKKSFELFKQHVPDGISLNENDEFLELDMDNPEDLFFYALTLINVFHDYPEAIKYFNKSLKIDPNQSEVLYCKALAYFQLNKLKLSLKIMDKAIELDSKNPEYLEAKGVILGELNRLSEAHAMFDRSIEITPSSSAWSNKGALHYRLKEFDNAINCFDEAIKLDFNDIYSIVSKAGIYSELKDYKTAEKYFKIAEAIDSEDADYLIEMGKHLLNKNEFKKSIEYLDRYLEIYDESAIVLMYKSMALSELGRDEESEICFKKALELDVNSLAVFDEVEIIEG